MREIWISYPCNDEFRKLFGEQAGFFQLGIHQASKQINIRAWRAQPGPVSTLAVTPGQHRSWASVVEQGLTAQICVFHPPDSFTTQTPSQKPERELIWCLLHPPALTPHLGVRVHSSEDRAQRWEPAQGKASGSLQVCQIWDQRSGMAAKKPSGSSHTSAGGTFPLSLEKSVFGWRALGQAYPTLLNSGVLCCTPALGRAHCFQQ